MKNNIVIGLSVGDLGKKVLDKFSHLVRRSKQRRLYEKVNYVVSADDLLFSSYF